MSHRRPARRALTPAGGLLHAKGQISLAAAVVAPGLMVLAIILFMGGVGRAPEPGRVAGVRGAG